MPTPQNGQTHPSHSSAVAEELFECIWSFSGIDAERVKVHLLTSLSSGVIRVKVLGLEIF